VLGGEGGGIGGGSVKQKGPAHTHTHSFSLVPWTLLFATGYTHTHIQSIYIYCGLEQLH
jgi:hypothetical protein